MALTLIPSTTKRARGQHGEQIDTANLDAAIALTIDLYGAIDNDSDNCLKNWLQAKRENNEPITAEEVSEILDGIFNVAIKIQARLIAARNGKNN